MNRNKPSVATSKYRKYAIFVNRVKLCKNRELLQEKWTGVEFKGIPSAIYVRTPQNPVKVSSVQMPEEKR